MVVKQHKFDVKVLLLSVSHSDQPEFKAAKCIVQLTLENHRIFPVFWKCIHFVVNLSYSSLFSCLFSFPLDIQMSDLKSNAPLNSYWMMGFAFSQNELLARLIQ